MENNVNNEEQVKEETNTQQVNETEDSTRKDKRIVKKVIGAIWKIVLWAIVIVVIFETVMGVLNMQKLNEDKDPVWYIDTKVEQKDGTTETTYNMGLYEINKVEDSNGKKISLKPFFIK